MYQLLARRAIGRTESSHFGDFFPAQTILEPGPDISPAEQIYSNCRTTIPGAADHHVFFPAFFHLDTDTTTIESYASHDGRLLHKVPGSSVLNTADYGRWDGGCVFTHPNLVELPNGDWVLPYTGYTNPHKYPHGGETFNIGLAVWPRGRMVAIETIDSGGFTTPAFLAPGTRLRINAITKRVGSIQIEVADLEGNPIPGRSFQDNERITGDHFWTPVRWNSNETIGVQKKEPVVLRFRMNKARIYGLEFE
jgi:hypothetical protein